MAQPMKRRGHGEDAIYWDDSKGRWYGTVSLGFDSGGKRLRRFRGACLPLCGQYRPGANAA